MSEVIDVQPVDSKAVIEPPKLYAIMTICEEEFCYSTVASVFMRAFDKNSTQAFRLADRLKLRGIVRCVRGMAREIAEMKAQKAEEILMKACGGCACQTDRRIKFKVEVE